ncbi:MAG: sterol desaturase family protein [Polyangiaceae bacterium]|nr:sterol desaturase family protein [Polyangiaceae bacterium]
MSASGRPELSEANEGDAIVSDLRFGSEQARAEKRAQCIREIPWWYNPWGHLFGTTGIGLTVLVISVTRMKNVLPLEWLVIPLTIILANAYEWRVHKYVLHKRRWPFGEIFEKHTPMHHGIYVTGDMEIQDPRELRLVLIPALGVLGVVLAMIPAALLLGTFVTPNTGWLFLVTSSLYMVTYECTHLLYHVPKKSFLGRMRLVRTLMRHHAIHHDPKLMQTTNFNVTLPLFDWILGTMKRTHHDLP